MTRVQSEKNATIQTLQQLLNSKEHEVQVQLTRTIASCRHSVSWGATVSQKKKGERDSRRFSRAN